MSRRTVYNCDLCSQDMAKDDSILAFPGGSDEYVEVGRCCQGRPIADLIEMFKKRDPSRDTATATKRRGET